MKKFHTDKEGKVTLIRNLETSHLENIIKWLERKAEKGIIVCYGGGGALEDIWYDEDHLYGKEALESLNYSAYKKELYKRRR